MYPVGQQTQWTPSPTRPQSPSQQQTSFDTLTSPSTPGFICITTAWYHVHTYGRLHDTVTAASSSSGAANSLYQPPHLNCQYLHVPRSIVPNLGREGRPIVLRANHFQVSMAPWLCKHQYDRLITYNRIMPRSVNRLEVTLPGEGKDRIFRVTIKWMAQVSLFNLEEALEGRTRQIPYDAY
ncbi:Protein argonaute-2 [Lucilia cuprina]|nr:Protein argonaute-2 [Lucilia cuprina]